MGVSFSTRESSSVAARAAVVLPERSLLLLHEHQSHTRLAVGSVLGSLDFHPASLSETLDQQSRSIAAAKLRLPPHVPSSV